MLFDPAGGFEDSRPAFVAAQLECDLLPIDGIFFECGAMIADCGRRQGSRSGDLDPSLKAGDFILQIRMLPELIGDPGPANRDDRDGNEERSEFHELSQIIPE